MKVSSKAYVTTGRVLYVLLYPLFLVHVSTRTRGLVFDQTGKILLVKNWISNGSWNLPGGGLHHRESPPACVSRELYEETGIEIDKGAWHYLAQRQKQLTKFLYFTATTTQSRALQCQTWEIIDAAWFDQDALPTRRSAFIDRLLSEYDRPGA